MGLTGPPPEGGGLFLPRGLSGRLNGQGLGGVLLRVAGPDGLGEQVDRAGEVGSGMGAMVSGSGKMADSEVDPSSMMCSCSVKLGMAKSACGDKMVHIIMYSTG